MKVLLTMLSLFGCYAFGQICNQNGNIVIFSNYDGGYLNINVDVNIPNLKIGVVSYEAVEVTFSGAYVNNITAIEYAGFNNSSNSNCGAAIATTSFIGAPGGVTPNIEFVPPVTYNDPNGYMYIDCAYSCGTGNQGGCNTAAQIYDYFETVFGGTVYTHETQYGCWSGTQNLSDGGNCCYAPPNPPTANFAASASTICVGECVDFTDLSTNSPTSWNWDFTPNPAGTSTLQNPTGICYDAPGVYTVTLIISNANGGDTTSQQILVNDVDTAVTVNSITLTSTATNATYQWINCATNQPIAGATNATFAPPTNGNYAVIVTENNCTDTSACYTIATIGLDQAAVGDLLTVYPNPTKGEFVLYDQQGVLSNQLITVTNLLGEVVYTAKVEGVKTTIDLSRVNDGVYFITAESNYGKLVTKMVKE